ncbi:ATP-binding protein [Streptomyces violaceorubidus]
MFVAGDARAESAKRVESAVGEGAMAVMLVTGTWSSRERAADAVQPGEIGKLFLFEKLTPEQLGRLCAEGRVELFDPGPVYAEGEDATCFYVLLEGTVVLTRRVGGDEVETTAPRSAGVRGRDAGVRRRPGTAGLQQLDAGHRADAVLRAPGGHVRGRHAGVVPHGRASAGGAVLGSKNTQRAIGQRERLLALGSLSAGLTHELNNPAAAAVRATSTLRERVAKMRHKLAVIAEGPFSRDALAGLIEIQERTAERVAKAPSLSPLEAADREDALGDWLADHGIEQGWQLAPTFVQAGLDTDWLEQVAAAVDAEILPGAVGWLNSRSRPSC